MSDQDKIAAQQAIMNTVPKYPIRNEIVYLAGPMNDTDDKNNLHLTTKNIALWLKSVIERARSNRYIVPEMVEWSGKGHDIYGSGIPLHDIELIKQCTVLVAYIRDQHQYGTFCEIAAAKALGLTVYSVESSPEGYPVAPWFVDELIDGSIYPEYIFNSNNELEVIETSEPYGLWAIERLVSLLGGDTVDYHNYIQSPEWKERAEEAKERARQRCQICNRHRTETILDAHHRTYERLGCELPEDITILCRTCHELYETNKRSKKYGI